jgi:hypothetical protein
MVEDNSKFYKHALCEETLTILKGQIDPQMTQAQSVSASMMEAINIMAAKTYDHEEILDKAHSTGSAVSIAKKFDLKFIAFKHLEEHPSYSLNTDIHTFLFEDDSFIVFSNGTMDISQNTQEYAFQLEDTRVTQTIFDEQDGTVQIILNNGITFDDIRDENYDTVLEESMAVYNEADDPTFDPYNAGGQEWSHYDVETLTQTVTDIFLALADDTAEAEVEVQSYDEGDGAFIHYTEGVDSHLLGEALDAIIDRTNLKGYTYEYNDGAYDKKSGYDRDSTIIFVSLDNNGISSHEKIKKKTWLLSLIKTDSRFNEGTQYHSLGQRITAHLTQTKDT